MEKQSHPPFLHRLDDYLLKRAQALADWLQVRFNRSCYFFGSLTSLVAGCLCGESAIQAPDVSFTFIFGALSFVSILISVLGLFLERIWQKNQTTRSVITSIRPQVRLRLLSWSPGGMAAVCVSLVLPPAGFMLWFGIAVACFIPVSMYFYSCTPKPPSLYTAKKGILPQGA